MYHLWKNVYLDPLTILSLGYLLFVCGGFFFFLVVQQRMWKLISLTRDQTLTPGVRGAES